MNDATLEDAMVVRFFKQVNSLSNNSEIPYSCVDDFMGWGHFDPSSHRDRARLNELRNQLKARVNAIARKGTDSTDGEGFIPFKLIVAVSGLKWRKIADSGYTENVISKGTQRVSNAIANMQGRTLCASNVLTANSEERVLLNHFIAQLEIDKRRLKEQLDLTSATLKEWHNRQAMINFDAPTSSEVFA